MKVFIGIREIAGYYANLKKGFDRLQIPSIFIDLSGNLYEYGGSNTPHALTRLLTYLRRRRISESNLLIEALWQGLQLAIRLPLFVWAVLKYDVFVFGFNSSFLLFCDLPVLKLLGKKIIHVFHGSDARPPYLEGNTSEEECITLTRVKKRTIRFIERYADVIISHPLYGHLHEKPFVSFLSIGLPCECCNADAESVKRVEGHVVRILHSPSSPTLKGTNQIRQAIENLQRRGYRLELIEISGRMHSEVINELVCCDFVVDQLYSDTPMAGFAGEAAFFGKPAVVGGYGWGEIRQILRADEIPPSHCCHPDDIESAIEELIVDKRYRAKLGSLARNFVTTKWAPQKVAERYLKLIQGNFPSRWICRPKDIRYLYGGGISQNTLKFMTRYIIDNGGKQALQITDKPELMQLIVDFAYNHKV